jgi:hypothetical protein
MPFAFNLFSENGLRIWEYVGQFATEAAQEFAQLLFQSRFHQSQFLAIPYPICGINSSKIAVDKRPSFGLNQAVF